MDTLISAILEAVGNEAPAKTVDIRVGPFWSVVETSVGAGMASTMRSEAHLHGSQPIPGAGSLLDLTPVQLAALLESESAPEAAIGLAAANALFTAAGPDLSEEKALAILEDRGAGRRVAMIGRFPFAEELRSSCAQLWVFERGLNRRQEDYGDEVMDQLLPQADVVAITATTLLNRTLPGVLACVRPDAFLMMLGPSTPLAPCLFEFGFDVLCGSVIDDAEAVLRAVGQGAVTPQIGGVRRVALWEEGQRKDARTQRRKGEN